MKRLLAAFAAATVCSALAAAPANAWTPAETVYLQIVKAKKVNATTGGDQTLVKGGYAMCDALVKQGMSRTAAITALFGTEPDARSVGADVLDAATAPRSLCPGAGLPRTTGAVAPTQTRTPAPVPAVSNTVGAIAVCRDGYVWRSATRSGSCRGHGGVARWL